ncbi:MAG TPA: ABC transporter ATP-binding protein [Anaeromyxobacteraceae bacterium]|nr:ABC transporter ATP-binding protein [Anaeromyxobacteraceae bacterium]
MSTQASTPSTVAAPPITARGVGKRFLSNGGEVVALDGVDVEVKPGEFLSIIGGSGCGKSTFLRILAGLEKRDAGHVAVDGTPIDGPSLDRGIMFQDSRLLPWLTVEKNVGFALAHLPKAEARERVAEAIRVVGLEGFEKAWPHQLSGGMAQRAAIARVLVNRPRVLLLDEPFGALDALTKIQMQQELLRIWQAEKSTVILVTHDIEEAVFLGDRVAIMSSRPGTVRRIVDVNLSRPRDRSDSAFASLRRKIYAEFFTVSDAEIEFQI